jgi:hypothetical protein
MQRSLRFCAFVFTALSVLATAIAVVLYAITFNSLGSKGPNLDAWGFLNAADALVPWIAVLVVLAVMTGFAHRSVIVPAACLGLASGVVGGLVFGAWHLGVFLSHVDQHIQPPELNSLILTIAAVAHEVAPAAIVLAAGAVLLAGIRGITVARRVRGGIALAPVAA